VPEEWNLLFRLHNRWWYGKREEGHSELEGRGKRWRKMQNWDVDVVDVVEVSAPKLLLKAWSQQKQKTVRDWLREWNHC
jgi:hypothetical protein